MPFKKNKGLEVGFCSQFGKGNKKIIKKKINMCIDNIQRKSCVYSTVGENSYCVSSDPGYTHSGAIKQLVQ